MAKGSKCKVCAGTGYKLLHDYTRLPPTAVRSGTCAVCGGTGRKRKPGSK